MYPSKFLGGFCCSQVSKPLVKVVSKSLSPALISLSLLNYNLIFLTAYKTLLSLSGDISVKNMRDYRLCYGITNS